MAKKKGAKKTTRKGAGKGVKKIVKKAERKVAKKATKKSAKKGAKNNKTIGSVNAIFQDSGLTGDFGSVVVGGPTPVQWIGSNTLPAGERLLIIVFDPNANHLADGCQVSLKTTGPFQIWTGQNSAPSNSLVLLLPAAQSSFNYLICKPKKPGKAKGTLTISAKNVLLTGPFKNGAAFPLKGTGHT
jgi:hypothetical protein